MKNEVLDFIERKFKKDCNWVNGNCYYFAMILKDRFPEGKIFYDVTYGHFIFQYHGGYYDWVGNVELYGHLVEWDKFDEYDSSVKKRVVRDCIL